MGFFGSTWILRTDIGLQLAGRKWFRNMTPVSGDFTTYCWWQWCCCRRWCPSRMHAPSAFNSPVWNRLLFVIVEENQCMPARRVQCRREAWWPKPTALCNCAGATILRRKGQVYTKMSGGMAECNLIAQHSLTQQEFARQKSTKTRSSHMCHSTIQQSQGFSLDRCPLAPVTTQNNCSTSSFAKVLGGYRGMKINEGKKTILTVGLCQRENVVSCMWLIMHKWQAAPSECWTWIEERWPICEHFYRGKIWHLVPSSN